MIAGKPSLSRAAVAWLLLVSLLGGVAGCKPEAKPQTPAETGSTATPENKNAAEEPAAPPAADLALIPDSLKTDAFEYYGLGNTEPLSYEVIADGTSPKVGEQTVRFTGMKDGGAQFTIDRTGDLAAAMGTQELELRSKGLFTIETSLGKIEGDSLEVPSSLAVGTTWKAEQSLLAEPGDRRVKSNAIYKVVRNEKVKTKAGEFEAILITGKGTLSLDGRKASLDMKQWLAKGKGAVKTEISTKFDDGTGTKISIELTK